MSALGTKRTSTRRYAMSVVGARTDIPQPYLSRIPLVLPLRTITVSPVLPLCCRDEVDRLHHCAQLRRVGRRNGGPRVCAGSVSGRTWFGSHQFEIARRVSGARARL